MKMIGIIPARMKATRFPDKPLVPILGMPMLGHCYHRTRLALGADNTYVATCDRVIADYVESIGGQAVMTADTHTRATTRSAEAMEVVERAVGNKVDVVIMVQGDEPSVHPDDLRALIAHFDDPAVSIVNLMYRCSSFEEFKDYNSVKVVVNAKGDALYFSREPIPSPWRGWEHLPRNIQTGIIAFRRDTLEEFNRMQESSLEQIESIDMNRILEAGEKIRMVLTQNPMVGVDVPEEVVQAEAMLRDDPVLADYINS